MERAANEKSLELKDEETLQKVEKSILDERVAGSKRAQAGSVCGRPFSEVKSSEILSPQFVYGAAASMQVLIKWLFSVEFMIMSKWIKAWMAEASGCSCF